MSSTRDVDKPISSDDILLDFCARGNVEVLLVIRDLQSATSAYFGVNSVHLCRQVFHGEGCMKPLTVLCAVCGYVDSVGHSVACPDGQQTNFSSC